MGFAGIDREWRRSGPRTRTVVGVSTISAFRFCSGGLGASPCACGFAQRNESVAVTKEKDGKMKAEKRKEGSKGSPIEAGCPRPKKIGRVLVRR